MIGLFLFSHYFIHHIYFSTMATGSHIGFHLGKVRPPTKCNCWSQLDPHIWFWSDL